MTKVYNGVRNAESQLQGPLDVQRARLATLAFLGFALATLTSEAAPADAAHTAPAAQRQYPKAQSVLTSAGTYASVSSAPNESTLSPPDTLWAVKATAWATIAQACLSGLALLGLFFTWREAKRAADAAREQLDSLDRPHVIPVDLSPYITIGDIKGIQLMFGAELKLKNFGRAPAEVKSIHLIVETSGLGHFDRNNYIPSSIGAILTEGEEYDSGMSLFARVDLTKEQDKYVRPMITNSRQRCAGVVHYSSPYTGIEYLRFFSYQQSNSSGPAMKNGAAANYDRALKRREKFDIRKIIKEIDEANVDKEVPLIDPSQLRKSIGPMDKFRKLVTRMFRHSKR